MKPILFNTEMVRAILEGRKTVTRRVIKGQDKNTMYAGRCALGVGLFDKETCMRVIEPPYKVNDILYVRETWTDWSCAECDCECVPDNGSGGCSAPKYLYKATDERPDKGWKPSIHMPKEAARLFLRVTDVRVERLQDMELDDFWEEGIKSYCDVCTVEATCINCTEQAEEEFKQLWDSTIKKDQAERYSWSANPYVWVIEFEVVDGK